MNTVLRNGTCREQAAPHCHPTRSIEAALTAINRVAVRLRASARTVQASRAVVAASRSSSDGGVP
ncbi:MAG: hypothetical protein IPK24_12470 [Kineosporiaceae bacterium]|nr:hypothetical protein [Kineosporiaceae bacterium]